MYHTYCNLYQRKHIIVFSIIVIYIIYNMHIEYNILKYWNNILQVWYYVGIKQNVNIPLNFQI